MVVGHIAPPQAPCLRLVRVAVVAVLVVVAAAVLFIKLFFVFLAAFDLAAATAAAGASAAIASLQGNSCACSHSYIIAITTITVWTAAMPLSILKVFLSL